VVYGLERRLAELSITTETEEMRGTSASSSSAGSSFQTSPAAPHVLSSLAESETPI